MNNILRIVHETPYSMSVTIILLAVMMILLLRKYHTTNEFVEAIFSKTGCLRILFSYFSLISALILITLGWCDYQLNKIFKYTITCVGVVEHEQIPGTVEQIPGTVRSEYRVDDFQINDDGTVTIYRSSENEFVTFPFLEITRTFPHKQLSADELKTFRQKKITRKQ